MPSVALSTAIADRRRSVQLFHALSDETRLAVIELLHDGERCVCELQDALDVAQSRLSFHLKVLKDAGLVLDRKEGRWVHYSLNREVFDEVLDAAGELKPSRRALPLRRAGAGCCD
ncbi:MAG TPA: metalloregulator ArsR/SmtB family transcription factor [Gemmatimonadaceae bacterium]|jgi:ArsR family transcriptional regulator